MTNQPTNPLEVFLDSAAALWQKHEQDIESLASRSGDRICRFGFTVIIDASGKIPHLTTRIAWSERIADELEQPIDLNQLKLFKDQP